MVYTEPNLEAPLPPALESDLIAVADTKLVLGNWYAECVMNGRSLPDFAALLGMSTANYGHTRALYQFLATHGHDYVRLERGRGAGEIRSMNLLDAAPSGWEDFIAAAWLAELATWMMMSGFLHADDRHVAGIARKVGEETYYHLKYVDGWLSVLGVSKAETRRFLDALGRRYPLALQWFGPPRAADPLHAAGLRDVPLAKLRETFAAEVAKGGDKLGAPLNLPKAAPKPGKDWRADARRAGPLPKGLFEMVRFKDPELAH